MPLPLRLARRLGSPAPPLPQQVRDPHQVRARLGPELLRQPRFQAPERLEGVAAIPHPRSSLHEPPHRILAQGIEVEQHQRVLFDGREVARPTSRVHPPHQAVADPGH